MFTDLHVLALISGLLIGALGDMWIGALMYVLVAQYATTPGELLMYAFVTVVANMVYQFRKGAK